MKPRSAWAPLESCAVPVQRCQCDDACDDTEVNANGDNMNGDSKEDIENRNMSPVRKI
jgi:hypothetical protein